jgi:hypothetical protein
VLRGKGIVRVQVQRRSFGGKPGDGLSSHRVEP